MSFLVDENGNPEPNRRETARCVECCRRKPVTLMKSKIYKITEYIDSICYFCDTPFCKGENLRGTPGRIDSLKLELQRKIKQL